MSSRSIYSDFSTSSPQNYIPKSLEDCIDLPSAKSAVKSFFQDINIQFPKDIQKINKLYYRVSSLLYLGGDQFKKKLKKVENSLTVLEFLDKESTKTLLDIIKKGVIDDLFFKQVKNCKKDLKEYLCKGNWKDRFLLENEFKDYKETLDFYSFDKDILNNFLYKEKKKPLEMNEENKKPNIDIKRTERNESKENLLVRFRYGFHPLNVVKFLLEQILEFVREHKFWENHGVFDTSLFSKDMKWKTFREYTLMLQYVNLNLLEEKQIFSFYINLHNLMAIDKFLIDNGSIGFYATKPKYIIGGSIIEMDWIKTRLAPEMKLLLCDFTTTCARVEVYDENTDLEGALKAYLEDIVQIENDLVRLPYSFVSFKLSTTLPKQGLLLFQKFFKEFKGDKVDFMKKIDTFTCVLTLEDLDDLENEKRQYGSLEEKEGVYKGHYITEGKYHYKDGFGEMEFKSGQKYYGEWKRDFQEGFGFLYSGNTLYCGEFRSNSKTGNGLLFYENGSIYLGKFKNGCFEDQGTLFFPTGEITGKWNDNEIKGNIRIHGLIKDEVIQKNIFEAKWEMMFNNQKSFFEKKKKVFLKSSRHLKLIELREKSDSAQNELDKIKKEIGDTKSFNFEILSKNKADCQQMIWNILYKLKSDFKSYFVQFFTYFNWRYKDIKHKSYETIKNDAKNDVDTFIKYISQKIHDITYGKIYLSEIEDDIHHYVIENIYDAFFNLYKLTVSLILINKSLNKKILI